MKVYMIIDESINYCGFLESVVDRIMRNIKIMNNEEKAKKFVDEEANKHLNDENVSFRNTTIIENPDLEEVFTDDSMYSCDIPYKYAKIIKGDYDDYEIIGYVELEVE